MTGAKPGDTVSRCIHTTYTGSLPANVHLYSTSTPGALAQYVDLTVTQGHAVRRAFPSCAGFIADAGGVVFNGTLQGFEQARTDFATGLDTNPGRSRRCWLTGNSVVYKVDATLQLGHA